MLPLTWRERPTPRTPVGLVAPGSAARRLRARLAVNPSAPLRLASFGDAALVVLGPEGALPWVDGALYVGEESDAPGLLLPTMLEPSVPAGLIRAALVDAGDSLPAIVLPAAGELTEPTILCLRRLVSLSTRVLEGLA